MKFVVLFALFFGLIAAHLQSKGVHTPRKERSSKVYTLPKQNNEELLSNYDDNKVGGYQFAHVVPYSVNLLQGKGRQTTEGTVWRMTIQSQGATSLSLTFSPFYLPEGGELYVIGEQETRGAYTSINNWKRESLTVWPVKGEWATIEYFQPSNVKGVATIQLATVAHGFRTLGFGDSGSCNNNVACDTGRWANQIRSSGMLLSNFGSRFCSGSLVNNVENDGRQLFLSANHCSPASGDIVMLNYQSPTCSPNVDGPTDDTIGGLESLASGVYSDFAILEIGETIPANWNAYLSGVSGVNTAPTAMTGIHHPSGDIKKKFLMPTKLVFPIDGSLMNLVNGIGVLLLGMMELLNLVHLDLLFMIKINVLLVNYMVELLHVQTLLMILMVLLGLLGVMV